MKHIIDLTGDNFDRVDFCEAKIIDLPISYNMPRKLQFTVWGAVILLGSEWIYDKEFLPTSIARTNQYVSGIGKIKITEINGGSIEIYPYEKLNGYPEKIVCAQKQDGTELVLSYQWEPENCCQEYLWECVNMWPYGFCRLNIFSKGRLTYEFDDMDLVMLSTYLANPKQYVFRN